MPTPEVKLPYFLLMVLVMLACGCTQSGPIAPTTDSPQQANPETPAAPSSQSGGERGAGDLFQVLPWNWTECEVLIAIVPVQQDRLRPFLPEGFEPGGAGLLVAPLPGTSLLGFEIFQCKSAQGEGEDITDAPYASIFAGVKPPQHAPWIGEGDQTYVKWETLIPDAKRRDALAAIGAPVRGGQVSLESPAPGGAVIGSVAFDTGGGFQITAAMARPQQQHEDFTFVEYSAGKSGLIGYIGRATDIADSQGNGQVVLQPGSWAEEVIGAPVANALVLYGVWSFADGTVQYSRI